MAQVTRLVGTHLAPVGAHRPLPTLCTTTVMVSLWRSRPPPLHCATATMVSLWGPIDHNQHPHHCDHGPPTSALAALERGASCVPMMAPHGGSSPEPTNQLVRPRVTPHVVPRQVGHSWFTPRSKLGHTSCAPQVFWVTPGSRPLWPQGVWVTPGSHLGHTSGGPTAFRSRLGHTSRGPKASGSHLGRTWVTPLVAPVRLGYTRVTPGPRPSWPLGVWVTPGSHPW